MNVEETSLEITLILCWLFPVLTVIASLEVIVWNIDTVFNCLSIFMVQYGLNEIKLAFDVQYKSVMLNLFTYLLSSLGLKGHKLPDLGLENADPEPIPLYISLSVSVAAVAANRPWLIIQSECFQSVSDLFSSHSRLRQHWLMTPVSAAASAPSLYTQQHSPSAARQCTGYLILQYRKLGALSNSVVCKLSPKTIHLGCQAT